MSKVTETVEALVRPVVESAGLTLWDVEFVKEGADHFLRVYIDKDGGADINDCETVSRAIDPVIDEADPIEGSYILEVSTPGIERVLKRPSDFEMFMGSKVEVRLYKPEHGAKVHVGLLAGYNGGEVTIGTDGKSLTFEGKNVSRVRIKYDFGD